MKTKLQALTLIAGLLCLPFAAAHHAWPVNRSVLVTVQGTVTSFTWGNPHPMIEIDVQGENGAIEQWSIGGPALNRMRGNGWTENTVRSGDMITGTGYQFSDGSRVIRLERVSLADGTELRVYARE